MTRTDDGPTLMVTRGVPTVQQVAALVAVVSAQQAAPVSESPVAPRAAARSRWGGPVRRMPLAHGAGAWRASGLDRR